MLSRGVVCERLSRDIDSSTQEFLSMEKYEGRGACRSGMVIGQHRASQKGRKKHTIDSVTSIISCMISSLSSVRNASIPTSMHTCKNVNDSKESWSKSTASKTPCGPSRVALCRDKICQDTALERLPAYQQMQNSGRSSSYLSMAKAQLQRALSLVFLYFMWFGHVEHV